MKNLSAPIISEIFEKRNNVYDFNPSGFVLPKVHRVFHGIESISYPGPQIWKMVPLKHAFKRKIKRWEPENCPSRLWKPYVQSLDFVNAYWANVLFFDPLKTSKKLKLFGCFQGSKKETLTQYGFITVYKKMISCYFVYLCYILFQFINIFQGLVDIN